MNKDYLLVDGYNIIFAWKKLNKLAEDNIEAAKDALINMLCNYLFYSNKKLYRICMCCTFLLKMLNSVLVFTFLLRIYEFCISLCFPTQDI